MKRLRRILVAAALAALVVLVALFGVAFAARWHDGPIGPFPGGPLVEGEPVAPPADGWGSVAKVQTLELEVAPDAPRSVTTWFLVVDGVLYVPSADAASKTWPGQVVQDPRVRVRLDGKLYELAATRVEDAEIGRRLSGAVREKYGFGNGERVEGAWAFALAPRSAATP
jgi:hypothetical protein